MMQEKPIRIIENEKIRGFNDRLQHGIEHALNFMLAASDNVNTQVSYFDPFLMPIDAYLSAYKRRGIMLRIHVENAYQGKLYLFFEMRTAIILGGLMKMILPTTLEAKLDQEIFDASDMDSFGEVGNQLSGILDRAFRTLTNKNIHLRMDFEKKVIGDEGIVGEEFSRDEEYVVLLSTITIPKHSSQKMTLLLPRSLYEVLLSLEIQLEGITPKIVYLYTWNEKLADDLQRKINSRYSKLITVHEPEKLFVVADHPNVVGVAMDLKSIQFPLNLQDSIFMKRIAAQRNLAKVPFFFSYDQSDVEGVKILKALGLSAASTQSLEKDFPKWAQSYLLDPSKT